MLYYYCITCKQVRGQEPGHTQVKKSLIVIQMVQTLHTSVNIPHVCRHRNVLTMFQQKLQLLVNSESTKL